MSGQETFCFSTLPHQPAGRQQSCWTRLCVDKSIEATTPHGPATRLATCVLGVARRYEWSEVARTACGASASDGRSADAWTERAPILRDREGVVDCHTSCAKHGRKRKRPTHTTPDGLAVHRRRCLHGLCHGSQWPWLTSGMQTASPDIARARRALNHLHPLVSSGGANNSVCFCGYLLLL